MCSKRGDRWDDGGIGVGVGGMTHDGVGGMTVSAACASHQRVRHVLKRSVAMRQLVTLMQIHIVYLGYFVSQNSTTVSVACASRRWLFERCRFVLKGVAAVRQLVTKMKVGPLLLQLQIVKLSQPNPQHIHEANSQMLNR